MSSKITPANVRSFVRGNSRMLLDVSGVYKLRPWEEDQLFLRSYLCSDCLSLGKCKGHCGCAVPNLFYDTKRVDNYGKWGSMMNKKTWTQFMEANDITDIKSVPLNRLAEIAKQYTDYYSGEEAMTYDIGLREDKAIADLGTLKINEVKKASFDIPNILPFGVQIKTIHAGCGCTVPSWSNTVAKPGESLTVEVQFEARQYGHFFKNVTVVFTDSRILNTVLSIKGKILRNDELETSAGVVNNLGSVDGAAVSDQAADNRPGEA